MKRPFEPRHANLAGPDPFGRPPRNQPVRPARRRPDNGPGDSRARRRPPERRSARELAGRAARAGAAYAVDTINRKAAEAVEALEGKVIR